MKSLTLDSLRRLISGRRKDRQESSFKRSESFKRISIKKNYLERGAKCRNPGKVARKQAQQREETKNAELIEYGEWIRCVHDETSALPETTKPCSPAPVKTLSNSSEFESRTDSAISVSLGRVWMDAPLAMTNAPRSLELPRPSSAVEPHPTGQRAHHSLESALKDRKEDKESYPSCSFLHSNRVGELSRPSESSEQLGGSKDSGFSFSVPHLSSAEGRGFFRKKKNGNFETCADGMRSSSLSKTNRTKKNKCKGRNEHGFSDMYQVVVNRPTRSMDAIRLDPIIFVPPEKRKSTVKKSYRVLEIRDYCLPRDAKPCLSDSSDVDKLYEEILEEFPQTTGNIDFSIVADDWYSDSSDMKLELISKCSSPVRQSDYSPIFKRRLVTRKKSSRRNIRYVAKPIHRAPSTLKRNKKLLKKTAGDITQKGYEKKRNRLIAPYIPKETPASAGPCCSRQLGGHHMHQLSFENTPSTSHHYYAVQPQEFQKRRTQRRFTHNEKRYHSVSSTRNRAMGSGSNSSSTNGGQSNVVSVSPNTRSRRRGNRRLTRNESRYHSEVRQEAVQQALAAMQNQPKPSLPMPSKRTSVMARSPDRGRRGSDSSSDDESIEDDHSTPDHDRARGLSLTPLQSDASSSTGTGTGSSREHHSGSREQPFGLREHHSGSREQHSGSREHQSASREHHSASRDHQTSSREHHSATREQHSATREHHSSYHRQPQHRHRHANGSHSRTVWESEERPSDNHRRDELPIPLPPRNVKPEPPDMDVPSISSRPPVPPPPPDITHNTYSVLPKRAPADRVNRLNQSRSSTEDGSGTGRWKVSAKIQQLLNTLKRPKRRPLPEFYEDDDIELEIAANPKDPHAPQAEGGIMTPAIGEPLVVPSGLPRNLEAAIQRYGTSSFKALAATVLDPNGKLTYSLTYGKLLSRSHKVAYMLLNKVWGGKGAESCLKSGDRVALVYSNSDPINYICAFYGCLFAGIVPVSIEVPLTRRDAGSQQIGFLLGSCSVSVALTSDACFKGLPKTTTGEVTQFKGWPKVHWVVTEHLPKLPKDWSPPPKYTDETPAYIEFSADRDGSVVGVTVTRAAMLAHCKALTQACNYTEGEVMVCVLDFKKETGLWHGIFTSVLNGMHVIHIPYALMKVSPAAWLHMITKHKATITVVKSRDLHWGLLATKEHKDVSLASLRLLLVGDGSNPWSLSSCDQFLAVFQPKGLRPDAVCPSSSSSESLTVAIRRPGRTGVNATGRGVLSMSGLSHGVVRVDQENSLTSLILQDSGQVLPGNVMVVVKQDGPSLLCKTDEVGELCICTGATASQYWGLSGLSNSVFKVIPYEEEGKPYGDKEFVRSGLLGFLGPGGLAFVCGSREGLMTVTGRKHNSDDIIATVLAVEPMKFVYRGRIAVFSIRVLRDERICVVAEQRPECTEEESFQWMSRVLQAVDSIHQVGLYCLALVPANCLPKTSLGGIHLSECKKRFVEGNLHPANVLLCPHTCVTNLPKPREIHSAVTSVPDVGPASVMVGNIVQGNRLASAQGRDMGMDEENESVKKFISEILRWRAHSTADHVIFTLLNSKGTATAVLTCSQLHKRAERIGALLLERAKINTGDHVALIFPPGIDLICAFYGCLYVGAVPVTIRPPHPQNLTTTLPTVRMIVDVSKSVLVLSNQSVMKLLRSKEASGVVDTKSWPLILDTDDMPKKRLTAFYRAPTAELLAYLDFSVSTTGMLAGIKMSHSSLTSLCRSMKLACELYPSRHIALCLDPYCGLGFALWVLSGVYSGHHSILIPPSEVEVNPGLWLTAVSQNRVRDTFCSYGVMELCTKGLGSSINHLKQRGINLGCVRTCVVVAEERPRVNLTNSFSKLFSAIGLSPRAVSSSFGCRVNISICLQGASSPEPTNVFVDLRALRNDRVSLVERGSPHSLCLLESGKLLPGVKVIIADPETKGQCGDSHLGEIWVQSPHNATGYFSIYGEDTEYNEHFNARLVTGNTNEVYARTGYLGFLRRIESVAAGPSMLTEAVDTTALADLSISSNNSGDGSEQHDAVFVVGALDETIILRGMRYHPIDIENSVLRAHKKIAECAVFTWTNLLVVVAELDGNESEALDLVPLITNAVLEEHHLIVGVAVVVDPGVVPINSRGEKQRMHLRDGFLADQLDPIYVAYNM